MSALLRTTAVLALGALLTLTGAARPERAGAVSCGPCPATTTTDLNLRAAPSLSAEVLLVMPAGAEIAWDPFQEQGDGFVAVTYGEVAGWAYRDYLFLFPGFATTTTDLNLRAEPGLGAEILLVMPAGSQVMTLGGPTNGFFAVRYAGTTAGWAHGDYLAHDAQGGDDGFAIGQAVVVVDGPLNYRAAPTTGAGIIMTLPTGTTGAILDGPVAADGWVWYQLGLPGYGPDGETPGWVAGVFLGAA